MLRSKRTKYKPYKARGIYACWSGHNKYLMPLSLIKKMGWGSNSERIDYGKHDKSLFEQIKRSNDEPFDKHK